MIAICLPSYDGKVDLRWMSAFVRTKDLLTQQNIEMEFVCVAGCGIIHFARNDLVTRALKTDADQVLFIDGKQLWEPIGILRLLEDLKYADVVAAPAVSKDNKFFASYEEEYDPPVEVPHLIKATHCSVAFMGLNRRVLEGMKKLHPELAYENDTGSHHNLFDTMIENKRFIGEDTAFSLRLIRAGYDVWVDEGIRVQRLVN